MLFRLFLAIAKRVHLSLLTWPSIVIIIIGFFWLKSLDLGQVSQQYHVIFKFMTACFTFLPHLLQTSHHFQVLSFTLSTDSHPLLMNYFIMIGCLLTGSIENSFAGDSDIEFAHVLLFVHCFSWPLNLK